MKTVLTMEERKARGAIFCGPGLTEQSHRDSCDINVIMAAYAKTGLVPVYPDQVPQHGDFTNVVDYQTALNVVIASQEAFDSLPAGVRKEFNYDPQEFLQALDDPKQRERLVKLGVVADSDAAGKESDGFSLSKQEELSQKAGKASTGAAGDQES